MKAGQLEIEILANVAQLQADMAKIKKAVGDTTGDVSRNVRAANDNLRNFGKGAGAGFQQFTREVAQLKGQLEPTWAALQRYKDQVRLLQQALREGAITHKQFVAEMRSAVGGYQSALKGVSSTTNAQRAGFQQLSYQIGDVATQFSMGARPMQIFSAQASQVVAAIGLMSNSSKGLIGFLGGPWGQILIGAVSVLGSFAAAHYGASDASDAHKDAAKDLKDAINDLHDATVREMQSTWASIQVDIDKANSMRTRAIETRKTLVAELELAKAKAGAAGQSVSPGAPSYSNLYNVGEQAKQEATARELQKQINDQNAQIAASDQTIRLQRGKQIGLEVAATYDGAAAATLKYDKALDVLNARLRSGKISEDGYRASLSALTATRDAEVEAANKSERTHRTRKAAISDEQKAYKRQYDDTQRFIEALQDEIAKIGLDEKAVRQLEVAKQMEAAQTAAQKKTITDLNTAREKALALQEAEKAAKANADIEKQIKQSQRELALIGMTDAAREKATLALSEQAEIEAVLVEIQKAEAAGNTELIAQLQHRIDLIHEKYDVERQGINIADQAERDADKLKLVNDQLQQMIGLLGNLGGLGGALGGVLGILTGNTSAIGGPIGQLLNLQIGSQEKDGKLIARTIGDEISAIFKQNGEFAKTFTGILQGAGTGMLAGNAVFGKQSTTEKLGSAIGGILGKEAGNALGKVVGGTLGKALGPLGSIAGGILGSLVGGLFTSVKWGRTIVSQSGVSAAAGNSNSSERAALAAGNNVFGALQDIADQFGGTVGDFGNIAVGVRHGDYRVNTGGTSLKKKNGAVDFNDDAEAAIAYAIQQAINRGAIEGVRAGTNVLLKATDDLQTNIEKALKFENVFSELQNLTDPLQYSLDGLGKELAQMTEIFDEAGATAEEYAQLQELYAIKQQQAMKDQLADLVSKFQERADLETQLLTLLGREEDALALSRESELLGIEDTLKPLQTMIYTLQDARAIIDQFGPLADSLRAYKQELLGTRSTNTFAVLTQQFRDTAALAKNGDATALGKLQDVSNAYLDAARENASSALDYQRAVGEVLGAVDSGIFAADSQVEYAQMQIDAVNYNSEILDKMRTEMTALQTRLVEQGASIERLARRWEGDGMPIRSESDNPVYIAVPDGQTIPVS